MLAGYLAAEDARTSEAELQSLLERDAAPIVRGVLARKRSGELEGEDVASAAREQLIRQLGALRRGERAEPIRDFRAYVASVAYAAWADHLRRENPQRSMLLNRIRYLLENRTARGGFALWEHEGRRWCGFATWTKNTSPAATPKLQWLLADPVAALRDAFGNRYWQRSELATLVSDLFTWLETPIELRDLVVVVAEMLEMSGRTEPLEGRVEPADATEAGTAHRTAAEELMWKEYLLWLWGQLKSLPARQCAAFLFNSGVVRDFELLGVASIREFAPLVAMAPEDFAALWQRLPLDDASIAAELECTRQQVINLRRIARDTLGRAWRDFSGREGIAGNKSARSASSSA